MKFISITSDGDYFLNGDKDGTNPKETTRDAGSVFVDGAATSVTIGYQDISGGFQGFSDGLMTTLDTNVIHGYGVILMVRVVGVTGTINIGYAG